MPPIELHLVSLEIIVLSEPTSVFSPHISEVDVDRWLHRATTLTFFNAFVVTFRFLEKANFALSTKLSRYGKLRLLLRLAARNGFVRCVDRSQTLTDYISIFFYDEGVIVYFRTCLSRTTSNPNDKGGMRIKTRWVETFIKSKTVL